MSTGRRLRRGARVQATVRDLRELAIEADNVRSLAGGMPDEMLEKYLLWTEKAERRLVSQLSYEDVTSLVHTRRYWTLRNMDRGSPRVRALVGLELDDRRQVFKTSASELEEVAARWREDPALIVVPDTNVLVEQSQRVEEMDWWQITGSSDDVRVVIPLIVIDELDRLKVTGRSKGASSARFAIGMLHGLLTEQPDVRPVLAERGDATATLEVLVDPPSHVRMADPDYEIIDRAVHVRRLSGGPTKLVTGDLGMELRALGQGLDTVFLAPSD